MGSGLNLSSNGSILFISFLNYKDTQVHRSEHHHIHSCLAVNKYTLHPTLTCRYICKDSSFVLPAVPLTAVLSFLRCSNTVEGLKSVVCFLTTLLSYCLVDSLGLYFEHLLQLRNATPQQ